MGKKKELPDLTVDRVKSGLQVLASGFDPRAQPSYTFAVMAQTFYDIEVAIDAGASQRAVFEVLVANGVDVNFTRFSQDLVRLRSLFPPRKTPPSVNPETIKSIGVGLASASIAHDAVASVASARRKSTDAPFVGLRADVAPAKAPRPRPRGIVKREDRLPIMERMPVCASAVLDLARFPDRGLKEASRTLVAILGHGWSIKTALQFLVGLQYAEWLAAPWPDEDAHAQLVKARAVALRVVKSDGTLPDAKMVVSALVKALKYVERKATQ